MEKYERDANQAAGRGSITNAEVKPERDANKAAGRGPLTNAQVKAQQDANKAAGRGSITNVEVKPEQKANKAAGHGSITNAQVVAVLGTASPSETLASLLGALEGGNVSLASAVVDNQKANWAEPIQAQLDAALAKADTTKPVAEHIKPFVTMLQKAYTESSLRTLAKKEMAGTLKKLSRQFDDKVSSMLFEFTKKYVEKLRSSGGAEAIGSRVQKMDDGSDDVQLYNATDSKYRKEADDAAYREAGAASAAALKKKIPVPPSQPFTTLLENMVFSLAGEQTFKEKVIKIGLETGAEVKLSDRKGSSLKGFLRLYEKALLKAVSLDLEYVDFSKIFDVLRAMLVAHSTAVAAKAQKAVYNSEMLQPCRSKCRLGGDSVTGWRDELINVKHAVGEYGLIGEIQIVRSKMLLQRETMGGHDGYDESRSLRGLYEACIASAGAGGIRPAKEMPSEAQQGGGGAKALPARELSKKEQKALTKLLAKRKKLLADLAKVDRGIEAITGVGTPGEVTFASFSASPN